MKIEEEATIILEDLGEYIQIDWSFESCYIKAIRRGLERIHDIEQKEKEANRNQEQINCSKLC